MNPAVVIDSTSSELNIQSFTALSASYAPISDTGAHYAASPRPALRIQLAQNDTGWTALETEVGVYGFGEDANDAVKDLLQAVIEHVDVLARQDALTPDLTMQLEYFQARIATQ